MFNVDVSLFSLKSAITINFCASHLGEVYLRRKLYGYPPALDRKIDKIREKKKANKTRPEIFDSVSKKSAVIDTNYWPVLRWLRY